MTFQCIFKKINNNLLRTSICLLGRPPLEENGKKRYTTGYSFKETDGARSSISGMERLIATLSGATEAIFIDLKAKILTINRFLRYPKAETQKRLRKPQSVSVHAIKSSFLLQSFLPASFRVRKRTAHLFVFVN